MEVRFSSEKTCYQVQIQYLKQKLIEYEGKLTGFELENKKLIDSNEFKLKEVDMLKKMQEKTVQ